MVDGKLTEDGRDVMNVQVILNSAHPTSEFNLENEEDAFLTVHTAEPEVPEDLSPGDEHSVGGDRETERELDTFRDENQALQEQLAGLERKLEEGKVRFRELWRTNCRCITEYDTMIAAKDREIEEPKSHLRARSGSLTPEGIESAHPMSGGGTPHREEPVRTRPRRGKAPPVDFVEVRLEDWLPSLERAKLWNEWTEDELLLQLAGHLRGRAHQEWSLLGADEKRTYAEAVKALRLRLHPGSRTLAVQEFRHTSQGDSEKVADFIRRLECTFNVAYGRDGMSVETRDTLLHGQLQDALKHELMQAPAVSGAQSYQELCLAARNEEKGLAELKKRQQYLKPSSQSQQPLLKLSQLASHHYLLQEVVVTLVISQGSASCATSQAT